MQSEGDTNDMATSPQLEAKSELDEEIANRVVENFEEVRLGVTNGSEIDTIQLMPIATQLETESRLYKDKVSEEIITTDFELSSGAAILPHPSKVVGEDSYFLTGQTWIGVADGVSQWSLEGTNQGVYAYDVIRNCEKLVSDGVNRPKDLLNLSVFKTRSLGSSTVLIDKVDGQALAVANVGDSEFIILRHGTIYKRSSPMLHLFNFPRRIENGDDPSNFAELYQVDSEKEDVIIAATDGLFDNLYDQKISSTVFKCLEADINLEEIAELLVINAQKVGQSSYSRSPFADNAQVAGYVGYTGGKIDDVAVIVSVVKRRTSSQSL